MTNALPAFLQQRQSKSIAGGLIANLGQGSPPYVSIAGNRFTLIDSGGAEEPVPTYDPKIGPYLDAVIIDVNEHMSKVYYDQAFDPNASQYAAPACFSDNGLAPSRSAAKPQSATCALCPKAEWGSKVSAVSGKGVKACHDTQKLALLIPGDDVTFLMRVPPNSLTNLRGYTAKFVGQQIDISDVITRISFEPNGVGTLKFEAVNYIDEASFNEREKRLAEKKTDALVGRTDLPRTDALPAAAAPAQIAPPQAQTPFVPAAGAPAGSPVSQPSPLPSAIPPQQAPITQPLAGGATTASPSEPPKRRRRTAAPDTAQAQGGQQPVATPAMAPFRQPGPDMTVAAQPNNFGIQQPAAGVPDDVSKTLDSIFGAN